MKTRLLLFSLSGVVALLVAGFLITTDDPKPRMYNGEAKALGNGNVRSFVTLDGDGQPSSIGVIFDEAALTGLPQHGDHEEHMTALALPKEASKTLFNHVSVDWNPYGHEPPDIYGLPHFDFHFYMISEAERDAIVPTDAEFEVKGQRLPEAQYIPAGYISPPGNLTIPRMGTHLLDPTSPELNGETFTQTFIWGFYDGAIHFLEPMITTAFIESVKGLDGQAVVTPLVQPQTVAKAGYYPTHYSVRYDAKAKAYSVALEGLTYHEAASTKAEE